jgi:hypothetical protein
MTFARFAVAASLLTMLSLSTGCAWMQRGSSPPESPTPLQLLTTFKASELGTSSSGDVLSSLTDLSFPGIEIVSSSQNAISVAGPIDLADRTWATIVSFGEDTLTVDAKYFIYVNDKPRGFFHHKVTNARMDVEKYISPDVLSANYPNEEERNLAVIRDILKGLTSAARNLKTQDSRVRSCVMAGNQLLEQRIAQYKASPSSMATISGMTGTAFDTPELGKGRIKLIVSNNVASLKMVCGPVSSDFTLMPEVRAMSVMPGGCDSTKPQTLGFLSDYSKLRERSANSYVYLASGNPLGRYNKFIISPVQMYYDGCPVNGTDVEVISGGKIKSQDALSFQVYMRDAISSAVRDSGLTVVSTGGPGVAKVRVAITGMKKSGFGRNLPLGMLTGDRAGSLSMEAEIIDTVTDDQVGAIVETQTGNRFSWVDYSSWDDANYVMSEWAKRFKDRLEEAHRAK